MPTARAWLRRRGRGLAAAVLVALAISGGVLLVRYQQTFHSPAFWARPSRISYCDRVYQTDGAGLRGEQVDAQHLSAIGRLVPILGWPLLAKKSSQGLQARGDAPCAMALYLRVDSDTYVAYGLLGGP